MSFQFMSENQTKIYIVIYICMHISAYMCTHTYTHTHSYSLCLQDIDRQK